MNDFAAVDLFDHKEHSDSKRDDESLGHHFFRGAFIEVNGILETMQIGSWVGCGNFKSKALLLPSTPAKAPITKDMCKAQTRNALQIHAPIVKVRHLLVMFHSCGDLLPIYCHSGRNGRNRTWWTCVALWALVSPSAGFQYRTPRGWQASGPASQIRYVTFTSRLMFWKRIARKQTPFQWRIWVNWSQATTVLQDNFSGKAIPHSYRIVIV